MWLGLKTSCRLYDGNFSNFIHVLVSYTRLCYGTLLQGLALALRNFQRERVMTMCARVHALEA